MKISKEKEVSNKENSSQSNYHFNSSDIKIREDKGEFYTEGFVATTHIDRAREDGFENTMFSREVMQQIVDAINAGGASIDNVGASRMVSIQHDWIKENDPSIQPIGVAVPPAQVRETGDGHYGAWVRTNLNKTHPDFDDVKYQIEQGYFPGYSFEFQGNEFNPLNISGRAVKFITKIGDFLGYAFASARLIANPMAVHTNFGYREIMNINEEVHDKMTEEIKEEPKVEETQAEVPKEEVKEEPAEKQEEVQEEAKVEETKEEVKEEVEKREVSIDTDEIVAKVRESKEFKEAIDTLQVRSKVLKKEDKMEENVSLREMQTAVSENNTVAYRDILIREQLVDKTLRDLPDGTYKTNPTIKLRCEGKGMRMVGGLQVRGTLDTDTNASTYTQSPVEFADLFAPGLIDTFNNRRDLFGFLRKEQHPGGIFYQWKMITDKDPESNDVFVDRDDASVQKNYSSKYNYQTPIKLARRGVSVTDFTLRYAAMPLGDLFQRELDIQMDFMMVETDNALFAEVADGTGNAPLGLEAVADSAGNTTLYGYTRSTANRLAPAAAADTYVAIGGNLTEAVLRNGVTKLEVAGTNLGDIAFIASPATRDMLFNLMDGARRFNTIEATFGFTKLKVATYDGTPIIIDPNCNVDGLYMIDTTQDVLVMAMEPRVVSLAKVGAATEAYIEMHFAHVYKQPRKIHMLDTLTGP